MAIQARIRHIFAADIIGRITEKSLGVDIVTENSDSILGMWQSEQWSSLALSDPDSGSVDILTTAGWLVCWSMYVFPLSTENL